MKPHIAVPLLALIATACAAPVQPLGPKDGHDLPPNDIGRVKIGDLAPDFTLEDMNGRRVTLSSFRDRKAVILVFYRGHW
jgi:cytochrome oxidase Cu insertion factor (SCO1/SenC/PrrC family)